MSGIDDSDMEGMGDELIRLATFFTKHGAMGCEEILNIRATPMHDLFIGELACEETLRAGGPTITFKRTRLYEELMAAAWAKAAELDAGVKDAGGVATHQSSPIAA